MATDPHRGSELNICTTSPTLMDCSPDRICSLAQLDGRAILDSASDRIRSIIARAITRVTFGRAHPKGARAPEQRAESHCMGDKRAVPDVTRTL